MITKDIKLVSGVLLLVILMAVGMAQGATTLKVCECKACGCQYLSIQEAIERASPGDTVLVRSGNFHGNINVSKPVILRGERWHGGDLPLINADGNGSCITVSADGATVENIRVTNSGNESGDAGIRVASDNCSIMKNSASQNGGAGIILDNARNCTIQENVARGNAYGICLLNSESNVLYQNWIYNSTSFDAYDDGLNHWDDGVKGNYYGSLNCTDENNDTICDSAYNITGSASVDRYPMVGSALSLL
jgi:parallel beta-helix repeat protein